MKTVSLYKDLELLLKKIIKQFSPDEEIKKFFRWDHIGAFFNSYDIPIRKIKDYKTINELRIVSNNIKHSDIINAEVKGTNIKEFKNKDQYNYDSLLKFYDRVKDKPKKFAKSLVEKIIEYLFVFDEERINKIIGQYEGRIEKETAIKFAEAFKKKKFN